jgi:hypothetical protein
MSDYKAALYKRVNIRGAPMCFQRSGADKAMQEMYCPECCACNGWCPTQPVPRPRPTPPRPARMRSRMMRR